MFSNFISRKIPRRRFLGESAVFVAVAAIGQPFSFLVPTEAPAYTRGISVPVVPATPAGIAPDGVADWSMYWVETPEGRKTLAIATNTPKGFAALSHKNRRVLGQVPLIADRPLMQARPGEFYLPEEAEPFSLQKEELQRPVELGERMTPDERRAKIAALRERGAFEEPREV